METTLEEQIENEPFIDNMPTKKVKIGDRIMYFNMNFPSSLRGLLKLVQVCICFLAMILVGFSQPVGDERGLAFLVTFIGLVVAFALLVAYTVMLNTRIDAGCWLMTETIYNLVMALAFAVAAIFMFLFNASYWADRNPAWQPLPALASGALFACAIVYIWDAAMLLIGWQRYSWRPNQFDERKESVIPQ